MKVLTLIFSLLVVSVYAGDKPVELLDRIHLVPYPEKVEYSEQKILLPAKVSVFGISDDNSMKRTRETIDNMFEMVPNIYYDYNGTNEYKIKFVLSTDVKHPEGYRLSINDDQIKISYSSEAGAFYGAQTLYQIFTFSYHGVDMLPGWHVPVEKDGYDKKYLPILEIEDKPQYKIRSFMVDMGRSVFPMPYLKHIIRLISHLKLNTLHIHLYDDELNGFRFSTLPLGEENPFAMDADGLKELVRYARSYHVTIIPELESWGHVASIVYHYPELYGAKGMYGGASFGIGEKTYNLLEKMYDEILSCLEDEAQIHVGLDEAKWAVLKGEEDKGHSPENMVGRIYQILQNAGERQNKKVTMHLWADHGGRPVPDEIKDKIVLQPWKYKASDEQEIVRSLEKYGQEITPIMMGGGIRSDCFNGDFGATRVWSQHGRKYSNVLGATICLWGTNDISGRLVGIYTGADYIWSPDTPKLLADDPFDEDLRSKVNKAMRNWQKIFPDALSENLDQDRGPEVLLGKYAWPPSTSKPVAPTAVWKYDGPLK